MSKRAAVVMAGGSGERFWPVSTKLRPKQFLSFESDGVSLLEQAYRRAAALAGEEQVYLSTLPHLAESSQTLFPGFRPENTLVEPAKRNTLGALVWTGASLMARHGDWEDLLVSVLTADQRISPLEDFLTTAGHALDLAGSTGGLATIGIKPTRPETGFGYVELGDQEGPGYRVARFREKPDLATAEKYVASGQFLWNSGMFFWSLGGFAQQLEEVDAALGRALHDLAAALRSDDQAGALAVFETLPSQSIDYALMERASQVFVAPASFAWDDLGAWDALPRTFGADELGNTVAGGTSRLIESGGNIVWSDGAEVCLLGVDNLVVVVHEGRVMIAPRGRCQDVKKFSS
jgi:mannose-1-phosphate guanylyltransferase